MRRFTGWVCAGLLVACGASAQAAEKSSLKKDNFATFGVLPTPTVDQVRVQAAKWLKEVGKYDAKRDDFDTVWAAKDASILDKLAETFILGDAEAAKILADARNANSSAPTAVPELLSNAKKPVFFRANLALAYARILVNRKVYEEGLEALKPIKPEQTIDPASYLFFKAVAEHGQMDRKSADETIARLLDDVPQAPERYKMVAALMHFDMLNWNEKSVLDKLASIGRKMDNVQRRLGLERGGKKTQKQQKEIVARLDELIKELENAASDSNCPNGGNCPSGGQAKNPSNGKPGSNVQASAPQQDSNGGDGKGPGDVDLKRLMEKAEVWGKLPPREREAVMRDATRGMDPRYREIIMEYMKRQSQASDR